ncbi:HAD family hydrolase [Nakamurella endophytica]|uniref:Hydrolase n=1 Tax=Nakamurella endophytica TaxID=1748367 RepID=A0A917SM02_9ACTN|nr:HAD hydrolase-like protein [Nakamurella endophytica]GGL88752.1 hydrolase [Nakamurella endophytica]
MTFTVGFDLDMTLIDPRPGMVRLFRTLAAETGLPLDGEAFVTRLGPPLHEEFARYGLAPETVDGLVRRYRELYPAIVVPCTTALPGAQDAVRSVAERGGRVVVVTAKYGPTARAHVEALGMPVAAVAGDLWSAAKAVALAQEHAEVFVGDHLGDIAGARAADALAVAVATGPISREDLEAAGADVVLDDLRQFPAWLDTYLHATVH